MSALPIASSTGLTSKPSISACSALIGSISVTVTRAPWPQRLGAALADVAVATDQHLLAADQHVGAAVDAVDQRVPGAVLVVELALGDRVVDVDRRERQSPAAANWYSRSTPVVVSSVTPWTDSAILVHLSLSVSKRLRSRPGTPCTRRSRPPRRAAPRRPSRTARRAAPAWWRRRRRRGSCWPARSARSASARRPTSTPRASRPSRRTPGRPWAPPGCRADRRRPPRPRGPGWRRCCRTPSEPRHRGATSVSMSTAVWIVMCSEPEMRAPLSGAPRAYSRRSAIRPGISCSASRISLRPNSASDRSATLKSMPLRPLGGQLVRSSSSTTLPRSTN